MATADQSLATLADLAAVPIRNLATEDTLESLPSGVYFRTATAQLAEDLPVTSTGVLIKYSRTVAEQMAWYLPRQTSFKAWARVKTSAGWSTWT